MHYVKKKKSTIYSVHIFKKICCAADAYVAINCAQLSVNRNEKDIFFSIKETADAVLKISRESGRFSILHITLFYRLTTTLNRRP